MSNAEQPSPVLLPAWAATMRTRDGLDLNVRPAAPDDAQVLGDFFNEVSPEDLRFRFLSATKHVTPGLARQLVDIDHTQTENLLAFDAQDRLVATAMIAAPKSSPPPCVTPAWRSSTRACTRRPR